MKLKTDSHPKLTELESAIGRFCFEMWASPLSGKLLVIWGPNGCGKTHASKAVRRWVNTLGHAKQFVSKPGHISFLHCVYWDWPVLLDAFKNGGWDVVDDMFAAPLLIIDDLGAGHDPSEVGTDKLCQVLSHRERKWTLITTNVPPASWAEKFDRRVASRFFRQSTIIDLSGVPDFNH